MFRAHAALSPQYSAASESPCACAWSTWGFQTPRLSAPIVERPGLNRSNWVKTMHGFGRLFKQPAGRSSLLVDAAARRSRRCVPGQGGGSNRLCMGHRLDDEPSTRYLSQASTRRARPPCALDSLPGAVSPERTTRLLTSNVHAHTTVVAIPSISARLEAPRADPFSIAATDEFLGV